VLRPFALCTGVVARAGVYEFLKNVQKNGPPGIVPSEECMNLTSPLRQHLIVPGAVSLPGKHYRKHDDRQADRGKDDCDINRH
jgi:hypothetical protein